MLNSGVVLSAVFLVLGIVITWKWLRTGLSDDLDELRAGTLRNEDRWAIWISWGIHGFIALATVVNLVTLVALVVGSFKRLAAG